MFSHRLRLGRAALFGLALPLTMLLAGCDRDHFTAGDARSSLQLADVTAAGAFHASGRYSSYSRLPTVSIWRDPERRGTFVLCVHGRDWAKLTSRAQHCEYFGIPPQLAESPGGAEFLSINEGSGQKTQTIWAVHEKRSEEVALVICNHGNNWLSGYVTSATSCAPFARPAQVDPRAMLKSINSGEWVGAQSFWENPNGSFLVCNHGKDSTGFLGLGGNVFGVAQSCEPLPVPSNLFPAGVKHPRLAAVNSDKSLPWEVWWQDDNGLVLRCQHDYVSTGMFGDYRLGAAQWCDYWTGLKPSDIYTGN